MSKLMNPNKCTTNTILPQEEPAVSYGKRMFVNASSDIVKDIQNAGVVGERLSQLNLNSRKKINDVKGDSSQMKDALNYCNMEPIKIQPIKTPLTSYSGYNNQEKYFETKLMPDNHGRMSVCVGRKSGSATINMNVDDYDLEKTYHTWKRIMDKDAVHTRSNLENDRFLTVCEDAKRMDRLPEVKNRNPPVANPDGPFEIERPDQPKQKRDNLDRTLTPKENSHRRDVFRKVTSNYVNTFHISQPHREEVPIPIKGVRRTNFPWLDNNRLKDIIQNSYGSAHNRSAHNRSAHNQSLSQSVGHSRQYPTEQPASQYEQPASQYEQPASQHVDQHRCNQQYADAQYADAQYADAQYADAQYADAQYADAQYADAQYADPREEACQFGYGQEPREEETQYAYDQSQRNYAEVDTHRCCRHDPHNNSKEFTGHQQNLQFKPPSFNDISKY